MKDGPEDFAKVSREIFAPIYPVIAKHIKGATCITRGKCIDLGSGPGLLGIALAEITELEVCLFDKDPVMLNFARENMMGKGLENRVKILQGDVHHIPLENATVDLAISRGSLYFWENPSQAFREIRRILTPRGQAWIGGSFGNKTLREEIFRQMRERDVTWEPKVRNRESADTVARFRKDLREANIGTYTIENDHRGFWIRFSGTSGKD